MSIEAGRAARKRVPRSSHAQVSLAPGRDPIATIDRQNQTRIARLIPLRMERMARSAFAFFRGTAAIMAGDLAATPVTGSFVQACGDCHLANFGLFATSERNVIFDLNDFDETLPAPWEWDVKRLATSTVLAALERGASYAQARDAALKTVASYRLNMQRLGETSPLQIWFSRVDARTFLSVLDRDQALRIERKQRDYAARGEHMPPTFVANRSGKLHFVEDPPIHRYVAGRRAGAVLALSSARRRHSRGRHRQRRHPQCDRLFQAGPDDALVLQIKEARVRARALCGQQ